MEDLQKKLSTATIILVLLSQLSQPSKGQVRSPGDDQSPINPQILRVIKDDLKVSFPQSSSKVTFPSGDGSQFSKQDRKPGDSFNFNPQINFVGSSSFIPASPESKQRPLQGQGAFSSLDQQPSSAGIVGHFSPLLPNTERVGGLAGLEQFDVSPYFADPEGRVAPSPPFVAPQALVIPGLPCGLSLNSSTVVCDPVTPYRTLDGSCNNLQDPTHGRAFTTLQRIFRKVEDPTLMRRLAVSGRLLPSPRVISERAREARPKQTQRDHNLLVMVLGQFIDHDLIVVPTARDPNKPDEDLKCPSCNSWATNLGCAPIPIPSGDAFFRGDGSPRCLAFTRSVGVIAADPSGKLFLENVNANTAFLDLSAVYGSHDCLGRLLRAFSGGKLLTTNTPASPYGLPVLASKSFGDCKTPFEQCYIAGDTRCNENPALLVMHTIFLREHNHLSKLIHAFNPKWEDEQIFQEARRINIAQFQNIVVKEFLPILLGNGLMRQYGLLPAGFSASEYQPRLKPKILQEFATAAFRIGHTLVPDHLPLADAGLRPTGSIPLFSVFNNPTIMQDTKQGSFVDAILRGLVSTRLEGADFKVVDTLRDQLFVNRTNRFSGGDLFSRNIARARDHGVAPYTAYRAACNLDPVKSWDQLGPIIPRDNLARLREAYEHWDDIDLFPGGLAEDVLPDGLVGPTFGCIIAMQFHALKFGDRFWYDNNRGNLSPPELASVYQSGVLSRLISRNFDNGKGLVPSDALRLPSKFSNPPVPAEELAPMDLRPWVDRQPRPPRPCQYRGRDYGAGAQVPSSPCLDCRCGEEGSLVCIDRPVDCVLLVRFVPDALFDEHCYRVCPPPPNASTRPPFPSPPFFGPRPNDAPFFRSAEVEKENQTN